MWFMSYTNDQHGRVSVCHALTRTHPIAAVVDFNRKGYGTSVLTFYREVESHEEEELKSSGISDLDGMVTIAYHG